MLSPGQREEAEAIFERLRAFRDERREARERLWGDLAGPELWRAVMGRQTGRLAVLSTAPADPTEN